MQGKPNTATTITATTPGRGVSDFFFFFSWIQPLSNHTREGFSYPSYETTPRFFSSFLPRQTNSPSPIYSIAFDLLFFEGRRQRGYNSWRREGTEAESDVAAFSSYITPLSPLGDMSSTCSDDAVVVRGGSSGWLVEVWCRWRGRPVSQNPG